MCFNQWYKYPNVEPTIGSEVLVCKNFKNKQIYAIGCRCQKHHRKMKKF